MLAIFVNTAIKFTVEGKRHLGAAFGNNAFKAEYMQDKVNTWCNEVRQLSEFAKTQPHAAFSAFIHGEQHRFTYFTRTIQGIEHYLQRLDELITNTFLPAILGSNISESERSFHALPIKIGGMGVSNRRK